MKLRKLFTVQLSKSNLSLSGSKRDCHAEGVRINYRQGRIFYYLKTFLMRERIKIR